MPALFRVVVGIDNITPGTSTSASLSLGSMRPYLQDLIDGLPAELPLWKFKLFTPTWNDPFEIAHPNAMAVECNSPRSRPARVWFEQTALPRKIASEGVDIWLGTCNYLPLRARTKKVLLVQSHQFFTNPEAYGFVRRSFLRWIVPRSVKAADCTGVQSADARRTLLRFVDVPEDSVSVTYNRLVKLSAKLSPATAADVPLKIMGCARPYVVYVSGLYPFKNHARLIEAFSRIRNEFPGLALILAGGDSEACTARDLHAVALRCGIEGDVFMPGRVSHVEAAALYCRAEASAFPSLEETFGMPVLEAMSLDCPVLTSNLSSMAELAGDAALLVDPRSIDSIAAGLRRILCDYELRAGLIRRGRERCSFFTKERTIGSIAQALRRAASGASS